MPDTHAEFKAFQAALPKPHAEATRFNLGAQAEIGRRASTVVEHEGWQTFLDHLTAMKATVDGKAESLKGQILGGAVLGEALTKMQFAYKDLCGESRGLDFAMQLIPSLITTGKRAAKILNIPTDEDKKPKKRKKNKHRGAG